MSSGRVVTIDVAKDYGISFAGIGAAMTAAAKVLSHGDSCVVYFSEGMHSIDMPGSLFNVSGLAAPVGGRLTIAGAGMLLTTLSLNTEGSGNNVIEGREGSARLTFRDLTFARTEQATTQAILLAADETSLTLKIQDGFPEIDTLLATRHGRFSNPEQGLYLRRYRRTANDGVQIVTNASCTQPNGNTSSCAWPPDINAQVHFLCGGDGCPNITSTAQGVYKLLVSLRSLPELQRYRKDIGNPSALVGVKIKHGGQSFYLRNAAGISFEDVRWLGHSRGIMSDCKDVVLRNTRVDRGPGRSDIEALATNGGGPQINGCNNLTIINHTSSGTGDDSLGLFAIAAGSVQGCHIRDSFARGILLNNVSDGFAATVTDPASGNIVLRCPIYRTNAAHPF